MSVCQTRCAKERAADDLELEFTMTSFNTRVDHMAEVLSNPAILSGGLEEG